MPGSQFVPRVQVIQPVVAAYRRPFFEALISSPSLQISVAASPRSPGLPDSVNCTSEHIDISHACTGLFGGRLLWQRGLRLHPQLGPGDVLVVTGNPRFLSNLPLMLAARRRGAAVAWWGHGWSATSTPGRAAVRMRLMRLMDAIMVYTETEVEDLAACGFDRRRLFALNNAIDQRPIQAARGQWSAEQLATFQREQGLTGRQLLLFCGRLRQDPPTDLDVALRALPMLSGRMENVELAVIGNGPAAARLQAVAHSLGIHQRVRWLGAIYDEARLAPWFLSATAFLYPGPIGLSLMQAFGYALPVLTHDRHREHNPEIAALRDGENGLLFPRGDHATLARRVAELCTDAALRARLSAAALNTVTRDYTLPNMVERFISAACAASAMRRPSGRAMPSLQSHATSAPP